MAEVFMPIYLTRTLESFITNTAAKFPVLLLTGARQVGKTSLLRRLKEDVRTYVTLDDPLALRLAKEDPPLFLQRFPAPALIDEIQYAPELLPYIKIAVDNDRRPGMYWLTGSQPFHLMKGVSESLAGRVAIVTLLGMSRRELSGQGGDTAPFVPNPDIPARANGNNGPVSLGELYRMIWRGSFPGIALDEAIDRSLFYASYLQTYLQRDLRDLSRVGDEMAFLRFIRAAAARTGRLLNLSDLARDADVAPNTAKSWLSILQSSGIVHLLDPWHRNVATRLIKAPKLYFMDTGLAAYLTEWSTPETLEAGAMSGAILETWIVGEILKGYLHNGLRPPLYYYRDKDKKEIDLLIVRDGVIHPLEIKKSASPRPSDARHFKTLAALGASIGHGAVICLIPEPMPLTRDVTAIPADIL
jgi:predicted AAA+ superfamily ATPase